MPLVYNYFVVQLFTELTSMSKRCFNIDVECIFKFRYDCDLFDLTLLVVIFPQHIMIKMLLRQHLERLENLQKYDKQI